MKRFVAHVLRRQPLACAAFAVASVALVFFGWNVIDGARQASRPQEPDLRLWMSPRYVARSWNLPNHEIDRIMQIERDVGRGADPRTLAEVLERTGLTLAQLQRRVEIADEQDRQRGSRRGRDDADR